MQYMCVCVVCLLFVCLLCSATRSEYDEYRDKYRMFDRALFCLSPENWLRRFCHLVLTKQLQPPSKPPVFDHVAPNTVFSGFLYLLR